MELSNDSGSEQTDLPQVLAPDGGAMHAEMPEILEGRYRMPDDGGSMFRTLRMTNELRGALDGVTVRPMPVTDPVRQIVRDLRSDVSRQIRAEVDLGDGRRLVVAAPDHQRVDMERVALATKEVVYLMKLLPEVRIGLLSFDHVIPMMHHDGKVMGLCFTFGDTIHINAGAVTEGLSEKFDSDVVRQREQGFHANFDNHPLESIVAHEYWHRYQSDWERRDPEGLRSFITDLVGKLFDGELEDSWVARRVGTLPPLVQAKAAYEVSEYAAANVNELMAELFRELVCADQQRPAAVKFFELIVKHRERRFAA